MFGAVCYHSSLSLELSRKLQLQQKRSLAVILGSDFKSYSNALSVTSLPRLDELREINCLQWAIKAQENPQHSDLFPINQNKTRQTNKFIEPLCRGTRLYKIAIPSMIGALNKHHNEANIFLQLTTTSTYNIEAYQP